MSVKLENISKKWGNFIGVDNANLDIGDNEFIVFLGPSGCGKTTTMRMIAGLEEPTSGNIYIDDICVNDLEPKDRDISMVFQNYGLYPNLSVYENIHFPLKVRKTDPSTRDAQIKKAADMVELGDLMHRLPKELSGGQRQRVALARAIVRSPKVFLMDEPLSNLDAKLRVSTRAQIKHLQHELQTTTIYVTHDQIEAMTLADRVVVMKNGVFQQVGTPKDIYNKPSNTFVAGFIGSPAMNLIHGDIENGVFHSDYVHITGLNSTHKGKVIIGFRAEDTTLVDSDDAMIKGPLYTVELLGDATLLTIRSHNPSHDDFITVKASKHMQKNIGDMISVNIAAEDCHLFAADSGERL